MQEYTPGFVELCRIDCHKIHIKMKLTDETVRGFRVAKIFRENTDRVSSINFSANGETLISSSDDDSIVIYDCLNGTYVLFQRLNLLSRAYVSAL